MTPTNGNRNDFNPIASPEKGLGEIKVRMVVRHETFRKRPVHNKEYDSPFPFSKKLCKFFQVSRSSCRDCIRKHGNFLSYQGAGLDFEVSFSFPITQEKVKAASSTAASALIILAPVGRV